MTRINGSVLLRINAVTPADPVAVLEPGGDPATIPILVEESGNCAAHALAESKKRSSSRWGSPSATRNRSPT